MKKIMVLVLALLLLGCQAEKPQVAEVPPTAFDVFCGRAQELGFTTTAIKPFEDGTAVWLGKDEGGCLGIVCQYNQTERTEEKWDRLAEGLLLFTSENDAGILQVFQEGAFRSVYAMASDESVIYGVRMVPEALQEDAGLLFRNLGFPDME